MSENKNTQSNKAADTDLENVAAGSKMGDNDLGSVSGGAIGDSDLGLIAGGAVKDDDLDGIAGGAMGDDDTTAAF